MKPCVQSLDGRTKRHKFIVLDWIDIKDFAIAKHVELDFNKGLSVITGETGAGKSILINALGAVLGNRVDTNVVRHGEKQAEIQASFNLPKQHQALAWLTEQELDDESQCIIRRVIPANKSSKAFINGRAVSATLLRDLGSLLVDIHGQHEHQSLLKPQTQQSLLDSYGNCTKLINEVSIEFAALQDAQQQLDKLTDHEKDLRDRLELVTFQLKELDNFAPKQGEWPTLEAEHKRLHHQAEVSQAVQSAIDSLSGTQFDSMGAVTQLGAARSQLSTILDFAPEAEQIISSIIEAETVLGEATISLNSLIDTSESDDESLDSVEARYSQYHSLARKYQTTPELLFESYVDLQQTQQQLDDPEAEKSSLNKKIAHHHSVYLNLAKELSSQRGKAADRLSKGVSDSMQLLGMRGGSFGIELEPVGGEWGSIHGNESINFKVVTNPGFPAQSLSRVASGGELSRISLAIQVLLAENKTISSMVFDEVDVGVGGQTAAIVGKLLKQLANHCQILCITHLPQVAAQGHSHYKVLKGSDHNSLNDETSAQIHLLDEQSRTQEIARMVGGETLTEESMAHAKSLINQS
ncbi:MAG: DNA repair protein RecN (Recombination protein N) [Saprospiraceae bacterium]